MRLGIFGGSFDPVHNGHLALARACQQQASLDEVWFMLAAIQPFKHAGPHATDAQRLEMLHLTIDDQPAWRVCTLEIDRGGISYTVETLRQIHTELPETKLYLLMGADAVRDAPHWREPAEIFRLAAPLVVRRAGEPEPELASLAPLCTTGTELRLIEMPAIDISSTDIRRRVAAGEPIDMLVPPAVSAFIERQKLYRSALD